MMKETLIIKVMTPFNKINMPSVLLAICNQMREKNKITF